MRRLHLAWLVAVMTACPGSEDASEDDTTSGGTDPSAATANTTPTLTGTAGTDETMTTTVNPVTSAATTESTTGGTGFDSEQTSDDGLFLLCSLEAIDPVTDPATVIDYGDGEGQIPTEIGEALLRNCGCHYTDLVPTDYVDYTTNLVPMGTYDDFFVDFAGALPVGFENEPVWRAVQERVIFQNPLPMPPQECDIEEGDGTIAPFDLNLFFTWLMAGAPDGANF